MGERTTLTRFVAILAASMAMLVTVPLQAAGATEAPPPPPADASCTNPPADVTVTVDDCETFVALWTPRIVDEAWLEHWVGLDGVPADVADEGFHDLDGATHGWLVASLAEHLIATRGFDGLTPGVRPADDDLVRTTSIMALLIFGKDQLHDIAEGIGDIGPGEASVPADTPSVLAPVADALAQTPTAAETIVPAPTSPAPPTVTETESALPASNGALAVTAQTPAPVATSTTLTVPTPTVPVPAPSADDLVNTIIGGLQPALTELDPITSTLLGSIGDVQQELFAVPPLGVVGGLTYRVCAETPSRPLACSINLPVGVPIPVDVTGDVLPDVLAHLTPRFTPPTVEIISLFPLRIRTTPSLDVGFRFSVDRLLPGSGPLPAHVFAVYDPPLADTRVEFGYDARESTLARRTAAEVTVKDVFAAITGDVEIEAELTHDDPGDDETLTAAIKKLAPQDQALPLEQDPTTVAVRFQPPPTELVANAHLQHVGGKNQDTITLDSDTNSVVTAQLVQEVDSQSPESRREFEAVIDRLPNHVEVDLNSEGGQQVITYEASSTIDNVHVRQSSVDDTSDPGTYTLNDIDVIDLPAAVQLTLTGSEDIRYSASSVVPQIQFLTETAETGDVQNQITATATGIPKEMHLSNLTGADTSTITYEADSALESLALGMYDKPNDETVIEALAEDFPLEMELVQTKSTGATDYTASGPIGSIAATISRAGGSFIELPGVDHATVKVAGDALGVDLLLHGLAGAHIDPSEEASYGLELSPGGQPFEAIAELDDPDRLAHVTVSNLPSTIQLDLDPEDGSATYTASEGIDEIDARYEQLDDGLVGHIVLTDLPTTIAATWETSGNNPDITYAADGNLGSINAFYQEAPGSTTFDALITDLPRFMAISGIETIVFDARTSPAGPSASDDVGSIQLRYGSDGFLPTTGDPEDHLYLDHDGVETNAELVYSGLEYLSVSVEGDDMVARVENSAPRFFNVDVSTPEMVLDAFIDSIPDVVQVQMADQFISYDASAPITEIAASVDRLNGDVITVDIVDVPAEILVEFDTDAATIDWTASAPTGGVNGSAQFGPATTGTSRTYNAEVGVLSIPAEWSASFADGHILFDGITGPIGLITATFTNHGTLNALAGDGISAVFDEVSGDLDAYVQISDLDLVEFQQLDGSGGDPGGLDASLNMGTGAEFGLFADLDLADGTALDAAGSILDFPTQMHLRMEDDRITYDGTGNPTIDLLASYGTADAIAATPAAPSVHGVGVRDGSSGGDDAVKADIFITGLPDGLDFDLASGVYSVLGFDPSIDSLTFDVALDDLVPTPISLLVQQVIGAGPVDFTFGPFTSGTATDGSKTISALYTASRPMGSLDGDVAIGDDEATLHVSNIPSSLAFDAVFGDANKSITITAAQSIDELSAGYKTGSDLNFTAGVTLGDVPTSVNLLLGEQGDAAGVQTPAFTYNASAPTLDIEAFLDDLVFGPASGAGFTLDVENLGSTVAGNLVGTTLQLGSTPATDSFMLVAHADLNFDFDIGFEAGPLVNEGDVEINLDVQELTIGFTDMSTLNVHLGYSLGVDGNYGTFTFGEKSDTHIDVFSNLDLEFTAFGVDVDFDVADVNIDLNLGNVIGDFRMARDQLGSWFSIPVGVPCDIQISIIPPEFDVGVINVVVQLRPDPQYTSTGATFTVPGGGPAWIATVNPLGVVPDFITDIIARFTTPYTGDQGITTSCD